MIKSQCIDEQLFGCISENAIKEKDYLSLIEALHLIDKNETIQLKNFLPALINYATMDDIINCYFASDATESGSNFSLLTTSIANMFKTFLENIVHIGPLRQPPERYFILSSTSGCKYVGQKGQYMADVIINNIKLFNDINKQFDKLNLGYDLRAIPLVSDVADINDLYAIRLYKKNSNIHISMTDVGFGVSQVLPIIVQSMLSQKKTILIEQPELHLHPAQQAELGDVFIKSALGQNKNTFLIESHSEHLILRLMRRIRETYYKNLPGGLPSIRPDDVAVLYVEADGENGSIVREMPLNERGELVKAWPGGFFEEGLREVLS